MNTYEYTITLSGHVHNLTFPSAATNCSIELDTEENMDKTYLCFRLETNTPCYIWEWLTRQQLEQYPLEAVHLQKR